MPEKNLHELVNAYRRNGEGKALILERVAALVYEGYSKFGFEDEDDAANALLKFHGRIVKLVDRFEDRGLSFDVYLATNLRYLARTVRRERRRLREREETCERAVLDEAESEARSSIEDRSASFDQACESQAEFRPSKRRPRARGGRVPRCQAEIAAYSSRLVFLAVKCAWEIDEAGISRVAISAGVDREWLAAAIEQARRSMESERSRLERLTQRRNASWTKLQLLGDRLRDETDPYRRVRLRLAEEREARRNARVMAEIAALKPIVPNSLVARILGLPKGTVDSGLYYLRKHYGDS
jgi:hypothetical protein